MDLDRGLIEECDLEVAALAIGVVADYCSAKACCPEHRYLTALFMAVGEMVVRGKNLDELRKDLAQVHDWVMASTGPEKTLAIEKGKKDRAEREASRVVDDQSFHSALDVLEKVFGGKFQSAGDGIAIMVVPPPPTPKRRVH